MITLLFNPNQPELIFSVATFFKNYPDELIVVASATPYELTDIQSMERIINEHKEAILKKRKKRGVIDKKDIFSTNKIGLLGIYPENKDACSCLIKFFEKNKKKIRLWIDNRSWDQGIQHYLSEFPKKIKIRPEKSYLEILQESELKIPPEWFLAEEAMKKTDLSNKLARRYLTIMSAGIVQNDHNLNWTNYYLKNFSLASEELARGINDPELNRIEKQINQAYDAESRLRRRFIDNAEAFARAKAMGRPIGFLYLGKINNFIDTASLLDYGKKKFPWLCIIMYINQGKCMIIADSNNLPIDGILERYRELIDDPKLFLSALEKAVINFKQ